MEMGIVVKSWKYVNEEGKQPTLAGEYAVRMNGKEVSSTGFNDGYATTEIVIPAAIMAEIETITEKVNQAIVDNFTK